MEDRQICWLYEGVGMFGQIGNLGGTGFVIDISAPYIQFTRLL